MERGAGDICKSALNIEFEQDWSVGLGATLGDGRTDRQTDTNTYTHTHTHTHTQAFFLKHIFGLW